MKNKRLEYNPPNRPQQSGWTSLYAKKYDRIFGDHGFIAFIKKLFGVVKWKKN